MLDLRFVRENQEAVAEAMKNRNASWDSARFAELDERRRSAIVAEEALQADRNAPKRAPSGHTNSLSCVLRRRERHSRTLRLY